MKAKICLFLVFIIFISIKGRAQTAVTDSSYKRCFVGSSLFLLGNFATKNKPDFFQLNLGYRITPKDVVSIEAITWKYRWPLGIPYGDDFESKGEEYPGYIRDFGLALAYQRFWWKGAYTAVHALNTLQTYVDENNNKIRHGYQLFMTYRLGYQIKLFKNRFFVEPSIAMTYWPIRTNVPESFARMDDKWNNYLLFEPGLHFGINF